MRSIQVFVAAVVLASPAAMAGGFTGNVGAVSDYLFRGLDQSSKGAAVQGGFDYSWDMGLYTGVWASNASIAGGNEADIYGGYGLVLGQFKLDFGGVYYLYSEDTEAGTSPNTDYVEVYVGGAVGPVSVKVFYTPQFGRDQGGAISGDADKNELLYFTTSVDLPLTDTFSIVPEVGVSAGDGVKDAFGDEYIDYSLTVIKSLSDGMSMSFGLVGTNLNPNPANDDNPKFVVGFKKNFKI